MSLGTGALKVGREPERLRNSKEVSMVTLRAGTHPCMQPPTDTVTLKEFSGKYSPDLILTNVQKGRDGLGARIRNDSLSNRSAKISSNPPHFICN